jgi:hypothetical protein
MSLTGTHPTHRVLPVVFLHLDPVDLGRAARVDLTWYNAANSDELWRFLFSNLKIPAGIAVKDYIRQWGVCSQDQLIKKIKTFAHQNISDRKEEILNGNNKPRSALIECFFPFNPEYHVKMAISNHCNRWKEFLGPAEKEGYITVSGEVLKSRNSESSVKENSLSQQEVVFFLKTLPSNPNVQGQSYMNRLEENGSAPLLECFSHTKTPFNDLLKEISQLCRKETSSLTAFSYSSWAASCKEPNTREF